MGENHCSHMGIVLLIHWPKRRDDSISNTSIIDHQPSVINHQSDSIEHCTAGTIVLPLSAMQENHGTDHDDHQCKDDEALQYKKDSCDPLVRLQQQGVLDDGEHDLQQYVQVSGQEVTSASASQQAANTPIPTDRQASSSTRTTMIRWNSIREDLSVCQVMRGITKFRKFCGALVNQEYVQLVIVILIAINAIMMGVATFDFVTDNSDVNAAFEMVDFAFLVVFTIEFGMQLIYHGLKLFLDGWLVFDCIVN